MKHWKAGIAAISTLAMLSIGLGATAQRVSDLPKEKPKTTRIAEGRRGGDKLISLPLEVMDLYLKLTKEQSEKIAPILKKVQTEMTGFLELGANPDQNALLAKTRALGTLIEQSDKDIEAVLTADQKKKIEPMFEEIRLLNSVGVARAGVAAVKLTADQKKQILALAEEYQKKRQELKQEERPTKGAEMAREYRGKVFALLTDEQKAALEKAVTADPFTRRPKRS
jgi:hypothetical protein